MRENDKYDIITLNFDLSNGGRIIVDPSPNIYVFHPSFQNHLFSSIISKSHSLSLQFSQMLIYKNINL